MGLEGWFGFAYLAGLVAAAIASAQSAKQPFRMPVCVPVEERQVDMVIWSDFLPRYQHHYPGTQCGKCGAPRACPERLKQ